MGPEAGHCRKNGPLSVPVVHIGVCLGVGLVVFISAEMTDQRPLDGLAAAMRQRQRQQRQQPQRPQLRSTARLEGERTAVPLWRSS